MKTEEPKQFDRTAYLENLNTKKGITETFEENKEFIEKNCGITLSNIELVGLRKITEEVLKEFYKQEKDANPEGPESLSWIDPNKEIPGRFFLEFYDLYMEDVDRLMEENSDEIFKEYFRRKQTSLHLP